GPVPDGIAAAAAGPPAGPDRSITDSGPIELGPQRIPGAGPHPGRFVATSTGPMPALDSQRSAVEQPEWFAGGRPDGEDAGPVTQAVDDTIVDGSVPGWQSPSPSWSAGPSTGPA